MHAVFFFLAGARVSPITRHAGRCFKALQYALVLTAFMKLIQAIDLL
jgi:hypothetical protein